MNRLNEGVIFVKQLVWEGNDRHHLLVREVAVEKKYFFRDEG